MRRFPISWDKTLCALGFRRNVKQIKRDYYHRKNSRFESLEERAMLAVDPIAHWSFDDGTGSAAFDSSTNSYDATLDGGTWTTHGIIDGALSLSRPSGEFVDISTAGQQITSNQAFTISGWIKASGVQGQQQTVFAINSNTGENKLLLFLGSSPNHQLNKQLVIYDQDWKDSIASPDISDNAWHHFAITRDDNDKISFYVDGEFLGDYTTTQSLAADDKWSIGQEYDESPLQESDHLTGTVDDYKIYDRALTPTEISELSSAPFLVDGKIQVSSLADSNDGDYSAGKLTLREAIEIATMLPGENIITFDENLFAGAPKTILLGDENADGSIDSAAGETPSALSIDSDVTIVGPGSELLTIDGGYNTRVIRVLDYLELDVAIEGVTITRGNAADGGGIFSRGNNLDLKEVVVRNNLAGNLAGAEYLGMSGGNKAYGGGIYFSGQNSSNRSTLRLSNSLVEGNYAGIGGGIYGYTSYADIYIDSTTIDSNIAYHSLTLDTGNDNFSVGPRTSSPSYGHGGGISFFTDYSLPSDHSEGDVKVTNSTISNNEAIRDAGGLSVSGGPRLDVMVNNSTFSDNLAYQIGGVKLRGIDAKLVNTTITNNHSTSSSYGGGIHNVSSSVADIVLNNSIVAGNTAGSSNSAKDINGSVNTTFSTHNLIGDTSTSGGLTGGDSNNNLVGYAVDSIFVTDGSGTPILMDNGGPTKTHSPAINSPALNAGDNTLTNLPRTDQRGFNRIADSTVDIGAYEAGNKILVDIASDTVDAFDGKTSLREAIAIANSATTSSIIEFSDVFNTSQIITLTDQDHDGTADELLIESEVTIVGPGSDLLTIDANDESRVIHSVGTTTLQGMAITGGNQGGIYSENNLNLQEIIVKENMNGPGIYHFNGSLIVVDSFIDDNHGSTGGIHAVFANEVEISGSTISNNTGIQSAGIRLVNIDFVDIYNSTFSGNIAHNGSGGIFLGDISTHTTQATLKNLTITDNTGIAGGLVSVINFASEGSLLSYNSIIAGNKNSLGEPVDVYGLFSPESSSNIIGVLPEGTGLEQDPVTASLSGDATTPVDPGLLPLANNGGLTKTHALTVDSPAINAGDSSLPTLPSTDQRGVGFPRVLSNGVDIGSYESTYDDPTSTNSEQIVSVNDPLLLAEGTTVTIGNSHLLTIDSDNLPEELVYTVTLPPQYGTLLLSGISTNSFSQADINAGLLEYRHDGQAVTQDSFGFSVDDGEGSASSGTFALNIGPVNGPLVVDRADGSFDIYGTDSIDLIEISDTQIDIGGVVYDRDVASAPYLRVFALDGSDTVNINTSTDSLVYGGDGNDTIKGGGGNDLLVGGTGDDSYLYIGNSQMGVDSFEEAPGEGDDSISFISLSTTNGIFVDLSSPNQTLVLEESSIPLLSFNGLAGQEIENVIGSNNDDIIIGNEYANIVFGLDGDDHIYGLSGNDFLYGGNDEDYLAGGLGDSDVLDGQAGLDNFEHLKANDATTTGSGFVATTENSAFSGTYLSAPAGDSSTADWAFNGLSTSVSAPFDVLISWPDLSNVTQATNAALTVTATFSDSSQESFTVTVDQTNRPQGNRLADNDWLTLGTVFKEGQSITDISVSLTGAGADGDVSLDGVRIEEASLSVASGTVEGTVFQDIDGDGFRDLDLSSAYEAETAHFVFVLDASSASQALGDGAALQQSKAIINSLERWLASNKEVGNAYVSLIVHEDDDTSNLGDDPSVGSGTAAILDVGGADGFQYASLPLLNSFGNGSSDVATLLDERIKLDSSTLTSAGDLLERVDTLFSETSNQPWSDNVSRHVFVLGGAFDENLTVTDEVEIRNAAARVRANYGATFHGLDFNLAELNSSAIDQTAINVMRLIDPEVRRINDNSALTGLISTLSSQTSTVSSDAPFVPDNFRIVSGPQHGTLIDNSAGEVLLTEGVDIPFTLIGTGFNYKLTTSGETSDSFVIVASDSSGTVSTPIVIDIENLTGTLDELSSDFAVMPFGEDFTASLTFFSETGRGSNSGQSTPISEPVLEDRLLFDDANGDGLRNHGETFVYTDANGHYEFNQVAQDASGEKGVRLVVSKTDNPYTSEEITGWAAPVAYVTADTPALIAADLGVSTESAQFAKISGYKYLDANENGIRDSDFFKNEQQRFVVILDISHSTDARFLEGSQIPDLNGDGIANAIIDAEIQATIDFIEYVEQENSQRNESDKIEIALMAFGAGSAYLHQAPFIVEARYGTYPWKMGYYDAVNPFDYELESEYLVPGRDNETTELISFIENIELLRTGQTITYQPPGVAVPNTAWGGNELYSYSKYLIPYSFGGATNYGSPLFRLAKQYGTQTFPNSSNYNHIPIFDEITTGGNAGYIEEAPTDILFLSDGKPNLAVGSRTFHPDFSYNDFVDEYSYYAESLRANGIDIHAFGVGDLAVQGPLDTIQGSPAEIIYDTDALRRAVTGQSTELFTEEGIGSWIIDLYADVGDDGFFTEEELLAGPVATTVTDAEGYYEFDEILAGKYFVRERQFADLRQTGPNTDETLLPILLQSFAGDDLSKVNVLEDAESGVIDYWINIDSREHAPLVNFGNTFDSVEIVNTPPQWTSTPTTSVEVGETYRYTMSATDDDHSVSFSLPPGEIVWPEDYTPPAEYDIQFTNDTDKELGYVTWKPDPALAGQSVRFIERVVDSEGLAGVAREVVIEVKGVNQAPVIWADDPLLDYSLPENLDLSGSVTPIEVVLGPGETTTELVTISRDVPNLTAEIVFTVDYSGSMDYGIDWLGNVFADIDQGLKEKGFSTRKYGLLQFGEEPIHSFYRFGGTSSQTFIDLANVEMVDGFLVDDYWLTISDTNTPQEINDKYIDFSQAIQSDIPEGFEEYGLEALSDALSFYEFEPSDYTSSQIVLVTDEEADWDNGDYSSYNDAYNAYVAKTESLRASLLNDNSGDPSSVFDNITLTTIADIRHEATGVSDIRSIFEESGGEWNDDGNSYSGVASNDEETIVSILKSHSANDSLDDAAIEEMYPSPNPNWPSIPSYTTGIDKYLDASLTIPDVGTGNAFIAFNYQGPDNFEYFSGTAGDDKWVRGRIHPTDGKIELDIPSAETIEAGVTYNVSLTFQRANNLILGFNKVSINGQYLDYEYDSDEELDWGRIDTNISVGEIGIGSFGGAVKVNDISFYTETDIYFGGQLDTTVYEYADDNFRVSFNDNQRSVFPALGVTHSGIAYTPTFQGGLLESTLFAQGDDYVPVYYFSELFGGQPAPATSGHVYEWNDFPDGHPQDYYRENTLDNYIPLTLDSGGSLWDYTLLRGQDPDINSSFKTAFVDSIVQQALDTTEIISAESLGEGFEDYRLIDQRILDGSIYYDFEIDLQGNGFSESFIFNANVSYLDDMTGDLTTDLLGKVPIFITAPYSAELLGYDPDGDNPITFSFAPITQAWIDTLPEENRPKLIDSGTANLSKDLLVWDVPDIALGVYEIVINGVDREGLAAVEPISWTIDVNPSGVNDNLPEYQGLSLEPGGDLLVEVPEAAVGHAQRLFINAIDYDGTEPFFVLGEGAPEFAYLNFRTGELNWIPTADDVVDGIATIPIRISDGRLIEDMTGGDPDLDYLVPSEISINLEIPVAPRRLANTNPSLSPIDDVYVTQGDAVSIDLSAFDFESEDLTYSVRGGDGNAAVVNETFVWSTENVDAGLFGTTVRFAVSVEDGSNGIDTEWFDVVVKPKNRDPEIYFDLEYAIPAGYDIRAPFFVFDIDGDTISSEMISITNGPDWFSIAEGDLPNQWYLEGAISNFPAGGLNGELITIDVQDGNGGKDRFETYLYLPPDLDAIKPLILPAGGGEPDKVIPANEPYEELFDVRAVVGDSLNEFTDFTLDDLKNSIRLDDDSIALGIQLVDIESITTSSSIIRSDNASLSDNTYTGIKVQWTPKYNQVLKHTVKLQIVDSHGDVAAEYSYPLDVTEVVNTGKAPQLTFDASVDAAIPIDVPWSLPFTALVDEDTANPLIDNAIQKISGPTGLTVTSNESAQTVGWTPQAGDVGKHDIFLQLTDVDGNIRVVDFSIEVYDSTPPSPVPTLSINENSFGLNSKPVFETGFLPDFAEGKPASFRIVASDVNGHDIQYQVINSNVPGISTGISAQFSSNGLLLWTPTDGSAGDYELTVEATDVRGAKTTATFNVAIKANSKPTVIFGENPNAFIGSAWTQSIDITDFDNDSIHVQLNQEAVDAGIYLMEPTAGGIANRWNIVWDAPDLQYDSIPISVEVSDGRSVADSYQIVESLSVYESGASNTLATLPSEIPIEFGETITFDLFNLKVNNDPIYWASVGDLPYPEGFTIGSDSIVRFTPAANSYVQPDGTLSDGPINETVNLSWDNPDPDGDDVITLNFSILLPNSDVIAPLNFDNGTVVETFTTTDSVFIYKPLELINDPLAFGIKWSLDEQPEGVLFDSSTGEITWDATSEHLDDIVEFKLRATDALDRVALQEIQLTVISSSSVPKLRTLFPANWVYGETLSTKLDFQDSQYSDVVVELYNSSGEISTNASYNHDTRILSWNKPEPHESLLIRTSKASSPHIFSETEVDFNFLQPLAEVDPFIPNSPAPVLASGASLAYNFEVLSGNQADMSYELLSIDGESLATYLSEYELESSDLGFTPNGELIWNPSDPEIGLHQIKVRVTDQNSRSTTRTFVIEVVPNNPTEIYSESTLTPIVGTRLVHTINAVDPDGGNLRFEFANPSQASDFSIHPTEGTIEWNAPHEVPAEVITLDVLVIDEWGSSITHSLTIDVQEDSLAPSLKFFLQDPDGNVLPPNSELNAGEIGNYLLWVQVDDNLGAKNVSWDLTVTDSSYEDGAPIEESISNNNSTKGLSTLFFRTDNGLGVNQGLLTLKFEYWESDGNTIPKVDVPEGELYEQEFTYYVHDPVAASVGKIVSLANSNNYVDLGETISSRTEVLGRANFSDENGVGTYSIRLTSVDDPTDFFYLEKDEPAIRTGENGPLTTIDPTLIKSGLYRLYLEVNCSGGCIQAIDERIIEIRNESRLGNLDLSFTDLQTDLSGIPFALTRSYSSASLVETDQGAVTPGDFGPGWTLNLTDATVEVAHVDQVTTTLGQALAEGTRITVQTPEGTIERFTFSPELISSEAEGLYRVAFISDSDTNSELSIADQPSDLMIRRDLLRNDGTFVSVNDSKSYSVDLFGSAFVLTTPSDVHMHYDPSTGMLQSIRDNNGRSIIIDPAESVTGESWTSEQRIHSTSEQNQTTAVLIRRNQDGNILQIVDPDGKIISYEYGDYKSDGDTVDTDPLSVNSFNLSSVTDRAGDIVYYDYENADFVNHLTHIYDNDHIKVLEATYYSADEPDITGVTEVGAGRLESLIDSSGESAGLGFTIDLGDGRMVTRVSTDGQQPVDEVVDNRGNVLRRVQLIDEGTDGGGADDRYLVTASIYNNNGSLSRQSVPFVVVGADNRYDEIPVSDPDSPEYSAADWANVLTYDTSDLDTTSFNVKTSTNALGQTTSYEYDDQDRVIKTESPNSIVTENVYHAYTGNLLETFSYPSGKPEEKFNHTSYEYSYGRITKSIQHDGDNQLVISETGYNSYGRVAWSKDARGNTTYYHYDNVGNQTHSWSVWQDPEGTINAVATVSITEYDDNDRVKNSETIEIQLDSVTATVEGYGELASKIDMGLLVSSTETIYDSKGRVEKTISHHGVESISLYDIRGQVIESRARGVDATGNSGWTVTRTLYDSQGRVEFTTDPYFVLDASGTYDPVNSSLPWYGTRTIYDELGRSVSSQRWSGILLSVATDAETSTPEVSLPASFDWDNPSSGSKISESKTGYDDLGRVEYTVNESEARTDYYYNAAGQQIAVLNPVVTINGTPTRHLTVSVYNHAGQLSETIANIAVTSSVDHPLLEISGNVVTSSDASVDSSNSRSSYYEYDEAGRQTAVLTPLFDHDQDDTTLTVHLRTETGYDNLGRRISSTTGLTQLSPYAADSIDRANARTTEYEYDDYGNLIAVNLPAEDFDAVGQEVQARYEYAYDVYGNRTTIRDNAFKLGGEVYYDHDGMPYDAVTNSDDHDTRVTKFTYDHRGAQTSRTLPLGTASTGVSDDFKETMVYGTTPLSDIATGDLGESVMLGQLELSVDIDGRVTVYRYDNSAGGSGRLVDKYCYDSTTDYDNDKASGTLDSYQEAVFYSYDEFGREIAVDIDRDGTGSIDHATTRKYDGEGRLTQVASPEGVINYGYDTATGQQVSVWTTDPAASVPSFENAITATKYTYDSLGRLSSVESIRRNSTNTFDGVTGDKTTYEYDLLGNLARVTAPNDVIADYQYDFLSRLIDLVHYRDINGNDQYDDPATDQLVARYEYELDVHGKRVASTDTDANGGVAHYDWVYDDLGRLVEESFDYDIDPNSPSNTDSHDYTTTFKYDLVGNRISQEIDRGNDAVIDEAFSYEYDANDRLRVERVNNDPDADFDETTFYQYDNGDGDTDYFDGTVQTAKRTYNDNHPSNTEPTDPATSETLYTYNSQGRLETVDQDGTLSEYEYNDDGFRVKQTVDSVETIYLVDANNLTGYTQILEEKDGATGVVTKTYVIGHDVLFEAASATAYNWLVYDGHGSTRALLDQNAAVVDNGDIAQLFAYTAYGKLIDLPGYASLASQALTTLLYSGEQTDGTGMQYLRARYYDPGTGRFNRVDPFAGNHEDPQSLHKYAYVHGDPINGIDPTGLFLGFAGLGGMLGNLASRLTTTVKVGAAGTAALSGASSAAYSFVFNDSPIRGAYVGAQIGTAFTMTAALNGGFTNASFELAKLTGFGFIGGLTRVINSSLDWYGENGAEFDWPGLESVQVFYEGFAATVWANAVSGFLEQRTPISDYKEAQALAELSISISSNIALEMANVQNQTKSFNKAIKDALDLSLYTFAYSKGFDILTGDVLKEAPIAKGVIITGIQNLIESVYRIFTPD